VSFTSIIAGGALLLVILAALKDGLTFTNTMIKGDIGLVENLGTLLFSKYVVPFEISSILFISAMVGAVLLAKREKQHID
jgi:NADH-quinone oxidoreductase subunit J